MDHKDTIKRFSNSKNLKETIHDTKDYDSAKAAKKLSSEALIGLLAIAEKLKLAMRSQDEEILKDMQRNKALLVMLAEYLVLNIDNPNVDTELLSYIQKFLGIKLEKGEEKEQEEEREEELTEEQKLQKQRLMAYEVYKVVNPNRLAGETEFDNFLNNVKTHGMKVALQNEGKEYAAHLSRSTLDNLTKPSIQSNHPKSKSSGMSR